eukprot:TRINITY_DN243_c0_g1_i1.p1 TRINITY_DN243_c0_g1~~TRINITY_DN243_c0_g1_i1.p1  ORF type:complete len:919 (+),score=291.71 TRINITY_DN243_c0_g1_i1:48-2804(+)
MTEQAKEGWEQQTERELTVLEKISQKVDGAMKLGFGVLSRSIADRPIVYIIVTTIVSIGLLMVMATQFEQESEASKLWTPQGTEALDDKAWVEGTFGFGERQQTFYAASGDGSNVVEKSRLLAFLREFTSVQAEVVPYGSEDLTWESLCVRDAGRCREPRSILNVWDYNETLLQNDPDPLATLNTPAAAAKLLNGGPPLEYYLGSAQRDAAGRITSVPALRLDGEFVNRIVVSQSKGQHDPRSEEWEKKTGETRNSKSIAAGLNFYYDSNGYVDSEAAKALDGDVAVIPIGVVLTIIFCCIVLGDKRSLRSHITVAGAGVLSVGMATVSAYGLALGFGVKYNPVVTVLVLVLLGIGVDDTFVIYDGWLQAEFDEDGKKRTDMKERLVHAMHEAGPSITTTSLTDMIAFGAGAATELPALRDFCIYACLGVGCDFLYQITFVVAVLFLDSRREHGEGCCGCCSGKPRMDVACCVSADDSSSWCGMKVKGEPKDDTRVLQVFMGRKLPPVLFSRLGTAVVFLVCFGLLAAGAVGTAELKMDFDYEWFVASDSSLQDTFDVRDQHFKGSNLPFDIYTGVADYSSQENQRLMLNLEAAVQANSWVLAGSVHSWHDSLREANGITGTSVIPSAQFFTLLRQFLATEDGAQYAGNLRWNSDNTSLVGTRFVGRYGDRATEDGQTSVDSMRSLRDTVKPFRDGPLNARAYAWPFVMFEGLAIIQRETLRNVIIAAGCVFLVTLVLLAKVSAAFTVLLAIGFIDIDLLGFTHWAGYTYNSVTCINVVLAIGLSVDYTAHIIRAYLTRSGRKRDRSAHALGEIGAAVVNGGFSTFLAVLPLALAKSYVFQVFFFMFFMIILFGLFHGALVAPAVLRWIGPSPYPGSPHIAHFDADEKGDAEALGAAAKPTEMETKPDKAASPTSASE